MAVCARHDDECRPAANPRRGPRAGAPLAEICARAVGAATPNFSGAEIEALVRAASSLALGRLHARAEAAALEQVFEREMDVSCI